MNVSFDKVLVTGGAGFIGSHIVDRLVDEGVKVRILDDLSTGDKKNISQHENNPNFEFIQGDIRDFCVVKKAVEDVDAVVHEAALVSVTKSIEDPLLSNCINVVGTLNLLKACSEANVKRFVFASSCAVYGDCEEVPINEESYLVPCSPYAVDKLVIEKYACVFNQNSDLETVGLRYFNVYGPRQACGPYSGVISVFVDSLLKNESVVIFGDGKQTRDFVNVLDVVEANLCALRSVDVGGEVFNVCTGKQTSVNGVFEVLRKVMDKDCVNPIYEKERGGDIKHSFGDGCRGFDKLGFKAKIGLEKGLKELVDWKAEG